ncbi:MAG: chemotaxis protein CheW [Clostridiales bacterium]|nr:chemotaxis protein CheW [Clostridiales bacterium]
MQENETILKVHKTDAVNKMGNFYTKEKYLNFAIEDELYSVETRYVIQILNMPEIITGPDMPTGMKGFVYLRGSLIPVYCTRRQFGKDDGSFCEHSCILVLMLGEKQLGLIVDRVLETITAAAGCVSRLTQSVCKEGHQYVKGILHLFDKRSAILINVPRMFAKHYYLD